ncbi:hypothetical protein Poly51_39680 [Rubripirellula tenax]|uniref:Uncharacterized protein n=1 Tax=Rubripirellula tenax TaxID=2528015 RepID=A0A5C6EPX9_9BACT|nr:hypothetical protein Poly51_39680 [Rubripirellula tenax]
MLTFLLAIAVDLLTGSTRKALEAVESFERPPVSPSTRWLRTTALLFFLLASGCLLSAGVIFALNPNNVANEFVGWTGVVCLHVCLLCAFRYSYVNSIS